MKPTYLWAGACALILAGCGSSSSHHNSADLGVDMASTDLLTTDDLTVPDMQPADFNVGDLGTDPCSAAPTDQFYVNGQSGNDSNSGAGPNCALKTITAALAASANSNGATIHLASGSYGPGETFPLVVDHGRSLVGAGANVTQIQGSSAAYKESGTGSFLDAHGPVFVTIVAGDTSGQSTLSGFTVLPSALLPSPSPGYIGIACDEGNGLGQQPPPTPSPSPESSPSPPELPPANLIIDGVTVGPNFDTGVALGSTVTPNSACNARIVRSTFTGDNVGLSTGRVRQRVPGGASGPSTQIGDGTSGGVIDSAACRNRSVLERLRVGAARRRKPFRERLSRHRGHRQPRGGGL